MIPERQKQARLGWSTVHMARHYTDSISSEDRRAAEHIGSLLDSPPPNDNPWVEASRLAPAASVQLPFKNRCRAARGTRHVPPMRCTGKGTRPSLYGPVHGRAADAQEQRRLFKMRIKRGFGCLMADLSLTYATARLLRADPLTRIPLRVTVPPCSGGTRHTQGRGTLLAASCAPPLLGTSTAQASAARRLSPSRPTGSTVSPRAVDLHHAGRRPAPGPGLRRHGHRRAWPATLDVNGNADEASPGTASSPSTSTLSESLTSPRQRTTGHRGPRVGRDRPCRLPVGDQHPIGATTTGQRGSCGTVPVRRRRCPTRP